ncbi:hypothetical protein L2E82_10240 [Cichorium intybus]|uniref:Uncharacterized protein n=1 Tax=Cichorium intybus TaxID=13427 RepID=A0ACB9GC16_CICIN|nr:hypothetical protein L2E82_10240 [Cichorium intybus]
MSHIPQTMSDLFHSQSLSLPLLLFPFFFFISMAAEYNDTNYPSCFTYNCANINISYPFWRIDSETPTLYCGYEGFGINCSKNGEEDTPIAYLGGDSYYVPNISYESERIVLVDYDVSAVVPVDDCPRVRHNIDLGDLPFNFWGQDVNLSCHFNCTRVPAFSREIPCLSTPTNKSYVHSLNEEPPNFNWTEYSCDEAVVTTAMEVFSSTRAVEMEFRRALMQRFELKWGRTEDCEKCEDSGGRCGYNKITTEVVCFCTGGKTTMGHCNGSGINWRLKILAAMHKTEDDKSVEVFVQQYGSLSTKRYTYAEVKKITSSFQVNLGQGGFGTVFKGKLSDGRLIAVKLLNSSKASGQEFINEVPSIGRTSHVNIVSLLGFCFEYHKRALLYEFMPNGDK